MRADGGAEWRCQLASLRQATRLAGECPDLQQIGRESLDGEERRGTLELLRSGDGVRRAASWRVRREPRAKEAGPTRRLGETTRRTRLELDDPFGRVNVDDSVSGFTTHTATHME